MNGRWRGMGGSLLAALVFGLLAVPEADARGGRGGGGHAGGGHAPRVSAAHRSFKMPSFKPPKMPHAAAPARSNATRVPARTSNTTARTSNTTARTNNAQPRASTTTTRASRATATGTANTNSASTAANTRSSTSSPYNYTYGTGTNTRNYRAYGYGRGYRNRYSGRGYGYGRSQGNNRAVIARLRSAHSSLARVDKDYQGHRVRAMHSIAMAVRQLSHRSMVSNTAGFANGMNNNMALAARQGGLNGNAGGRRIGNANGNGNRNRNQRVPQAQSDTQVSMALRTLQGANMQLTSQGSNTSGHARARGHVQHAMRELSTALRIR